MLNAILLQCVSVIVLGLVVGLTVDWHSGASVAMGGAALSLWAARGGAATVTGTAADGSVCVANPAETEGPFPADGTNVREGQTVNILTEEGVIREDIRTKAKTDYKFSN